MSEEEDVDAGLTGVEEEQMNEKSKDEGNQEKSSPVRE